MRRPVLLAAMLVIAIPRAAPAQDAGAAVSPLAPAPSNAPPAAKPSPALTDPREIVRRAAENDHANEEKSRNYTYIERDEEHKLDSKGGVKSTESKTYEILFLAGEQTRRLVAKNDRALPPKEAAKEDERLDKLIKKREQETSEQRQKRLAEEEKQREKDREFVQEIADAYNFTLLPPEALDGRDTWVISGEPRPGYVPHSKDARFLPKFRFQVWIDQAECQWVRLDVVPIETVSVGLLLFRLYPGSHLDVEQTRVNDEVWLPSRLAVKLDARLALLKKFNLELNSSFRDYKKFRAEARILQPSELPPQPSAALPPPATHAPPQ